MRATAGAISFLFVTALAIGCGYRTTELDSTSNQETNSVSASGLTTATSGESSAQLLAELESAYRDSSHERLAAFFQRWHESVKPTTYNEATRPHEKELLALFATFFRPFDVNSLTGRELFGDQTEYYCGVRYVIVPTMVHYRVGDEGTTQTLANFRPTVKFWPADVLYLTPEYQRALDAYLDAGFSSVVRGGDEQAFIAACDESQRRRDFLTHYVRIGFSDNGWDLCSYPTFDLCTFSGDRKSACVHFSMEFVSGMTKLTQDQGQWRVESSNILGIH